MSGALVDLYCALHALRLAFDQKASTTEIIAHFDLVHLRLDTVIQLSGRDLFNNAFRRFANRLSVKAGR